MPDLFPFSVADSFKGQPSCPEFSSKRSRKSRKCAQKYVKNKKSIVYKESKTDSRFLVFEGFPKHQARKMDYVEM